MFFYKYLNFLIVSIFMSLSAGSSPSCFPRIFAHWVQDWVWAETRSHLLQNDLPHVMQRFARAKRLFFATSRAQMIKAPGAAHPYAKGIPLQVKSQSCCASSLFSDVEENAFCQTSARGSGSSISSRLGFSAYVTSR